MQKLRVGILGATGMVGQKFIELLSNHPLFEIIIVAASPQSAGKTFGEAVTDRWEMDSIIPERIASLQVLSVKDDIERIAQKVDFVFSALNMDKEDIKMIELNYAAHNIPVVSNNSAHRWTVDVPIIIPEINPEHIALLDVQRKARDLGKGFIVVKPNCSLQSYVIMLSALKEYRPTNVNVTSLQAISGAGKTFKTWPEMRDNVIPFINCEEEKSEREPLKIWGKIEQGTITLANTPSISATCIRIPVSHGHMANVLVTFEKKPTKKEIITAINKFNNIHKKTRLPSSPEQLIQYFEDSTRPQTLLDRNFSSGMGISVGRLEEDKFFDWRFISLSHNNIRGAAGGSILLAELLFDKGYIVSQ